MYFNVICSSPTSKLCSSRLSTLDGIREKWASLAVPCTAGEARSPLRVLSLFPTEEIKGKKVSPGTELCHLGERGDTSQVKIFPLTLSNASKLVFSLLQQHAGTSPPHTWTSTKALSSMAGFSRGSWTVAERGRSQFTGHCTIHSQD